jgi:hypothetical protein
MTTPRVIGGGGILSLLYFIDPDSGFLSPSWWFVFEVSSWLHRTMACSLHFQHPNHALLMNDVFKINGETLLGVGLI